MYGQRHEPFAEFVGEWSEEVTAQGTDASSLH